MTSQPSDRRQEPRRPAQRRAVIVAPGLELAAVITDLSASGMRLRLDRALTPPVRILVVDIADALAHEAEVVWRKGQDIGVKKHSQTSLRGLTPQRLTLARDAWLRAGGR